MISLRPITHDDLPFLRQLYGSTRSEELTAVPWPPAQKEAFLAMQFQAQHHHYQSQYASANFDIIEQQSEAIGRLYVDYRPDVIWIIDIALLPAYRNQGLGTTLLRTILAEGNKTNRPVGLHVECHNPARHLYKRLGFQPEADNGVYYQMQWTPSPLAVAS